MLSSNPRIWMPPFKELHYFDMQPACGRPSESLRAHLDARLRYWAVEGLRALRDPEAARLRDLGALARFDLGALAGRRGVARYLRIFDRAARSGRVTGEITPAYGLLSEAEIRCVLQALGPDLRVILILRDPLDRILSHISKDARRLGNAQRLAFADSPACRRRTDYAGILRRWQGVFGEASVFVAFFDEVLERPAELTTRLERFLDAERAAAPEVLPAKNSFREVSDLADPALLRRAAEISRDETEALLELCPSPYANRWLARAEAALSAGWVDEAHHGVTRV